MAPRKNPRQVNCDSDGLIARPDKKLPPGLKAKDLLGIPWRAAFALQADGWFLRQDCIWNKPNPMPESVTDRCTKSHEYMFLLAKSPRYYFDHIAIREPGVIPAGTKGAKGSAERFAMEGVNSRPPEYKVYDGMRNKRSVWRITTKPFKGAHFATFPPELVEPPILAGTSAAGHCPACGIRWIRDTTRQAITPDATVSDTRKPLHTDTYSRHKVKIPGGQSLVSTVTETIGWKASCSCGVDPVPDIVLDPFGGSGTTAAVASRLNRDYCIIELNPAYSEFIDERIARKK